MIRIVRVLSTVLSALLLSSAPGFGHPVTASDDSGAVPLDPAVRVGKLENGFTYYLRKNDTPGRAVFRLAVNAGPQNEDPDQLGLAHMVEHLAFDGTKNFPGKSLVEYLKSAGLLLGAGIRAETHDVTFYQLSVPVNDVALYGNAYRILREWAQELVLDPEAMNVERGAILGEIRLGGREYQLQQEEEMLIQDRPLDLREQEARNIRTAPHESVVRFYRDWYRPDLEAAIVVGDIDLDDAEKRVKALFSDLLMPAHPRPLEDYAAKDTVPLTGQNRFFVRTHEQLDGQALVTYMKSRTRRPVAVTVADYRQVQVEQLLDRLLERRAKQLQASYTAPCQRLSINFDRTGAYFGRRARVSSLRTMLICQRREDMEEGFRIVMRELEGIRRHGFSEAELVQAKAELAGRPSPSISSQLVAPSTCDPNEMLADHYQSHFAEGAAAPTPEFARGLNLKLLNALTVEETNLLASSVIRTDRDFDILIRTSPEQKASLPSQAAFGAWIAGIQREKIPVRPQPDPLPTELMSAGEIARLPKGSIATVSLVEEIGATRIKLDNGIDLLLKPSGSGPIRIDGFRAGGIGMYEDADRMSARAAGAVVRNAGVDKYDKFKLEALMGERALFVNANIDEQGAKLWGVGSRSQLELLLQLMYLSVTAPRSDPAAFEEWKRRRLREQDLRATSTVLSSALQERFESLKDESPQQPLRIEAVDFTRAFQIYRDRISKTGDYTFVITGDYAVDDIRPLLVKYLGALPATCSKAGKTMPPSRVVRQQSLEKHLYAGQSDGVQVNLVFPGTYVDTFMNRIQLHLLAAAIQMRAFERLREKEAGTYAVSADAEIYDAVPADRDMGTFAFRINFNTTSQDIPRMIAAAKDEIMRLCKDGFDQKLFDAVIAVAKAERSRGILGPYGTWGHYLQEQLQKGCDLTEILKYDAIVGDTLTRDKLSVAAARYLSDDHMMSFVLFPEQDKKSALAK